MKLDTLKALNAARNSRIACVLVTNLDDGNDMLFTENDMPEDHFKEPVEKCLRTGKSGTTEIAGKEYFLNAHLPPVRLIVIGAVHISQALAPMAKMTGYDMEVIDPRTAFATSERFEGVPVYADWPEDILKDRPLDAYCALAAVTHDPKIDDYPLAQALKANCFYVGALGSKKTHAKRVSRLTEEGVSEEQINRINAPIGMDIGAASPQEIAVAVMAEIISAFRKRGLGEVE